MADNKLNPKDRQATIRLSPITCCLLASALWFLVSCSAWDIKREVTIPNQVYDVKADEPVVKEPAMPDFVPASEDVSPVKTRIIDVVARNTPLSDVLHVIADATGLNLVMERGVAPEMPVTATLKNVTAEDALNSIFSSADYFYTIKGNMLVVKAVDTKIYEIGSPSVIQTYSVDVGGDILGSALAGVTTTGGGGGGGGSSSIKGSITQTAKNDATAFGFWTAIEKSLTSILGAQSGQAVPAPPIAAPGQPQQAVENVLPGQAQPQAAASVPPQQSFTVNRLTGTIVITASKRNLERIEQYLDAIKKIINRQVLIEAKIIEVQLSDGLQYGIDWTQALGKWRGVFNSATFGTKNFASAVPTGSSVFSVGTTGNFTALLNALQQQGEVRTLSNPRVNIMNGQTALLSVGTSTSFIANVNTTTTTTGTTPVITFTVNTSSVLSGIMIGMVPFISENGEVSLTITPIVSNLRVLTPASVGSASSGNVTTISLPTVDLREMSTTVKVRDGQMVIIGGLISKTENLQDNKVPGIGDMPGIGGLLTSRNKSENRSELVVVLKPLILSR